MPLYSWFTGILVKFHKDILPKKPQKTFEKDILIFFTIIVLWINEGRSCKYYEIVRLNTTKPQCLIEQFCNIYNFVPHLFIK